MVSFLFQFFLSLYKFMNPMTFSSEMHLFQSWGWIPAQVCFVTFSPM